MTEKKNSKTNVLLIVVIVLLVAIIIGGIAIFLKLSKKPLESQAVKKIGTEAGVITNEDDFANMKLDEPFSFTTMYERDIYIKNGKEATCYIGNSDSNYYDDMYIQIYIDDPNNSDELGEEIYVSQIIPRGSHIESFTTNRKLEPGNYPGTLVYSCVDEEGNLAGDMPVVVDIHVE